jgi:hypothetical protein
MKAKILAYTEEGDCGSIDGITIIEKEFSSKEELKKFIVNNIKSIKKEVLRWKKAGLFPKDQIKDFYSLISIVKEFNEEYL